MAQSAPTASAHNIRWLFYGRSELRAGWRLLIFLAIIFGLNAVKGVTDRMMARVMDKGTLFFTGEVLVFFIFLLGSWIMARIEGRKVADYGLPGSRAFRGQFWQGAVLGFVSVTVLLVALRIAGVFQFGGMGIHGIDIWKWGAVWGVAFLAVGLKEEFMFRGYAQFTLSTGIGFWPAAVLWSTLFGFGHLGNAGENWAGALAGVAYGLVSCLLLQRTGNLWMPIGLHAGWDWAETYFYGVADSGNISSRHVFNPSFSGPRWLTGGTVGPEGSLLCFVLLVAMWFVFAAWFRRERLSLDF
jgi:membrane protease YdiL (CAAX protease family)